jgi:colanic acid biosynthesis glycosyl transferase WcaI
MRILVIGINYSPELTGIGKYSGEMGSWLTKNGCEVTMVTAMPYYPDWKVREGYRGKFWYKEAIDGVTVYRCPLYVPANPTGLKRLIHEASFFISSLFVIIRLLFQKSFDLVLPIAPPFHLGFLALFYRFFKRSTIIYHIQDLQVDAAKELKILKPNAIFGLLFALERFILNRVNVVSTISEGMLKRVKSKTKNQTMLFPNWVDTVNFYPIANKESLKPKWGFSTEDCLVLYSGSIGEKQGIDSIIRIAASVQTHIDIKFVICGSGPFKRDLMKMAEDLQLDNVLFLPLQGSDVFNEFLNIADIHLVLQKGDASDLVMPSKLSTILSVGGLALVTANPGTTLFEVISDHHMGIVIKPEDEELLKNTILRCSQDDFSRERTNARAYAEHFLNKDSILSGLLTKIN